MATEKNISHYRKSYEKHALLEAHLPSSPFDLFSDWLAEQQRTGNGEVNAMTLSCISRDGFPKSRVVLLKSYAPQGFVFFTNYSSEKGLAIAANPKVCLSFFFQDTERQVIIKGLAEKTTDKDSDRYFGERPEDHKLGALASMQSTVIDSREVLEKTMEELERTYKGKPIARPKHWGGYVVRPVSIEFWQGRKSRLHDRILYTVDPKGIWKTERLAP